VNPQVQDMPTRRIPGGAAAAPAATTPVRSPAAPLARPLPGTVRVRFGTGMARPRTDVAEDLRGVPA
jgi:hypothetical protein